MTPADLRSAIETAKAASWAPLIFKVRLQSCPVQMQPTDHANYRGIPIDVTSQRSHLLCEGGRKIAIDGEW